jgi:hypothetical protein
MSDLQQGQSFGNQSKLLTAKDVVIKSHMDLARTGWESTSRINANLAQIPSFPYCSQMYEGPIVSGSAITIGRMPHMFMMYAYHSVYVVYFHQEHTTDLG